MVLFFYDLHCANLNDFNKKCNNLFIVFYTRNCEKYDLLLCCGSDSMKLFFGVYEYKNDAQKTLACSRLSVLLFPPSRLALSGFSIPCSTQKVFGFFLVCAAEKPKPRFDGSKC